MTVIRSRWTRSSVEADLEDGLGQRGGAMDDRQASQPLL